uniref:triacylglycerol lipase n=1 Tax=Parascaris univalens TaxID=6257 RepID=A0A915AVN0_PARUN
MPQKVMDLSQTTLSFSGCGFLCIYHAGVCAAIKEYAPQLQRNKMAGASAGSIAAAGLLCNVCISEATSTILKVVTQARSRALGALHPAFNLIEVVRANLDATLPVNAHELCTGRLQISLTRERDRKNVIVSEFKTKEELIQAILCSCFIPYYCGRIPPEFRGEQYLDGGWSDNQPVIDSNTVTISPFSGESDICPPDFDSASLFGFEVAGTSIRFTARNIYRLTVCLIPPSTEVCSRICRQGFEDAVRFLTRNGIIPCARCLAVQSNLIEVPLTKAALSNRTRSYHKLTTSASRRRLDAECDECCSKSGPMEDNSISSLFPKIMQKTLDEALEGESRLWGYLLSFRVFNWLRTATVTIKLPFEILFIICKNVANWLAGLRTTDWLSGRLQLVVDFLLKEVEKQRAMYSARLTCQLAITELDVTNAGRCYECKEHVLNVKLSPEAQLELDALRRRDSLISSKRILNAAKSSQKPLEEITKSTAKTTSQKDFVTLSHVVEYAKAHDAVLAYYYTDDDNKVRMCEIFDVHDPERRHRCHSHLEQDLPIMGNRRHRCHSLLTNEEVEYKQGSEAMKPTYERSMTRTTTTDQHSGVVTSSPNAPSVISCDPDSGLSMAEESHDCIDDNNRRDACFPPMRELNRSNSTRSSAKLHRNTAGYMRRRTTSSTSRKHASLTFPRSFESCGGLPGSIRSKPLAKTARIFSSDSDLETDEKFFVPNRRTRGTSEEYDGETE